MSHLRQGDDRRLGQNDEPEAAKSRRDVDAYLLRMRRGPNQRRKRAKGISPNRDE